MNGRWFLLCGGFCCSLIASPSLGAADPPSAVVVVLKPGESKEVLVVWDDVPITRAAFLWVTTKSRITDRDDIDGKSDAQSNGAGISIDKKKSEEVCNMLAPPDRKSSTTTVAGVFKVSADSAARPGVSKLYARWGGGQGAVDLRYAEIRVVIKPD